MRGCEKGEGFVMYCKSLWLVVSFGFIVTHGQLIRARSIEDLIHDGFQARASLDLIGGIPVIRVDLSRQNINSLDGLDRLTVRVDGVINSTAAVSIKSLENIYLNLSGNILGAAHERLLTFDLLGDRLVGLNVSANKFKTFPTTVKEIPRLRILDLSDNQLSDDSGNRFNPVNVPTPQTIEQLNLSGNLFTCCPRGLPSYGKLKVLNLACNRISNEQFVSYAYGTSLIPKSVEELNLQGNFLVSVPQGLPTYGSMRDLSLADNHIAVAQCCNSFGESYMPSGLERLDLSGNKLTEPPTGIRSLFKLKELDLSDNAINQTDFYNRYHE